jgi:hypothetical protein
MLGLEICPSVRLRSSLKKEDLPLCLVSVLDLELTIHTSSRIIDQ